MTVTFASRCLLLLLAATAVGGCKRAPSDGSSASASASGSSGSTSSSADISPDPPTFNEQFQTRNPRVCAKVTHVPSVAEATVMVQCDQESASRTDGSGPTFLLATDISLQMGSARAYNPDVDDHWDSIDPSARVYPLRGSSTAYTCTPVNQYSQGKNCGKSFGGEVGKGACWRTSFGDWRCAMTIGGTSQELQVPGPTAF